MLLQTMDGASHDMAATRQDGYATKADWDRHRDLIARLYQDNHLKEVMRVMESQHNFKATSVSYSVHYFSITSRLFSSELRCIRLASINGVWTRITKRAKWEQQFAKENNDRTKEKNL